MWGRGGGGGGGRGVLFSRVLEGCSCGPCANEAKVDQSTEMYFLLSDLFI